MNFDLLIKNGLVVDGTGADTFRADVGVRAGRIAAIGDLSEASAETTIDASGKCVTPGFIDPHSHADLSVLFQPSMTNYLMQGVTTVVGGNCGHSYAPVGDEMYRAAIIDSRVQYAANPSYFQMTQLLFPKADAVRALREEYGVEMDWHSFSEYLDRCNAQPMDGNIAPLAGYSAIRGTVMGLDCLREATDAELEAMERLTRECMEQGAFGLSTGADPQYVPGPFATDAETVRMLRVVRDFGGVFASHTRNVGPDGRPDRMGGYRTMLEQALAAGVRANVSHVHTLGMGATGEETARAAEETLRYFEQMERAGVDLSYDVIPSPYSMDMTTPYFSTFLRPFVLMSGSRAQLAKNFGVPDFRKMVRTVIEAGMYPLMDARQPMMSMYGMLAVSRHKNPAYVGKNLLACAAEAGVDPLDLVMDLFREDPDMGAMLMMPDAEKSNEILCRHCMAMPCSDGFTGDKTMNFGLNEDLMMTPNPMNFCFAVRYLTQHPKARFEDTIRTMTGFVAERFNIAGRGVLREGAFADIVVLDRAALHSYDRDENVLQYPEGIDAVIVNGALTISHKRHTGAAAGRMLRRDEK